LGKRFLKAHAILMVWAFLISMIRGYIKLQKLKWMTDIKENAVSGKEGRLMEKSQFKKMYPGLKVKELNLFHVSNGRRMYCYITCLEDIEFICCSEPGQIWCEETGKTCKGKGIGLIEPTIPFDMPKLPPRDSFKPVKPEKK
jgi:hypothetical protein